MISSYSEAVEALYRRINFERLGTEKYSSNDLKLERMGRLLESLGNPHLHSPVVHVAGTKGKGTTCTLVAEILQQAGYRVGLYTSPHRERVEERFVVNGQLPAEQDFVRLVNQLCPVLEALDQQEPGNGPTFFECVNALAWLYFQEQKVDLTVLEVGLGGRLDSTNICSPLVTAITCISYDHTKILGETLREIAGEKAGIIKPGIPVISGNSPPEALQRIHEQAVSQQAPLRQAGRDFRSRVLVPWKPVSRQQQVLIETPGRTLELTLKFPGAVYAENAALAVACVEELIAQGFKLSDQQIQQAAENVQLPLRFEILAESPLLIADSAHNPASLSALTKTLQSVFPDQKKTLLLAVSRDKDYEEMCRQLTGIERVIATSYLGNERALPAETLRKILEQQYSGEIQQAETPEQALQAAFRQSDSQDVLVASGSLFFAAEVSQLTRQKFGSDLIQPAGK